MTCYVPSGTLNSTLLYETVSPLHLLTMYTAFVAACAAYDCQNLSFLHYRHYTPSLTQWTAVINSLHGMGWTYNSVSHCGQLEADCRLCGEAVWAVLQRRDRTQQTQHQRHKSSLLPLFRTSVRTRVNGFLDRCVLITSLSHYQPGQWDQLLCNAKQC